MLRQSIFSSSITSTSSSSSSSFCIVLTLKQASSEFFIETMKRPVLDRAKILFFYLLRSSSALATEGAGGGGVSTTFAAAATATSSSTLVSTHPSHQHQHAPTLPTTSTTSTTSALDHGQIQLRLARRTDVPSIQRCNLATLPENYNSQFYCDHLRQWGHLAIVAEHVMPTNSRTTNSRTSNSRRNNNNNNMIPSLPGVPFPRMIGGGGGSSQQQNQQPKIVAYVLGKVDQDYKKPEILDDTNYGDQDEEEEWTTESVFATMTNGAGSGLADAYMRGKNNNNNKVSTTPSITNKMGHVTSLAVLDEFRRQGLARALMDQLHLHLKQYEGCHGVSLHVRTSNTAAIGLYERDGYNVEQVISSYYHDGEDAYLMRKVLQNSKSSSTTLSLQQRASTTSNTNKWRPAFTSSSSSQQRRSGGRPPWQDKNSDLRLPRILHQVEELGNGIFMKKNQEQQHHHKHRQQQEQQEEAVEEEELEELLTGTV
mmetsp:Transcript_17550/g.26006  ORF Transcript_17550/g.26006 Transcript_17550/m.26006 type:complete len:483 (-) Transcript_17550:400-1848(-)